MWSRGNHLVMAADKDPGVIVNYRFPSSFVQRYMRARGASIGLTMRNLHTWTDFTGLDPETGQFLTVPLDRRWTVRFNFNF